MIALTTHRNVEGDLDSNFDRPPEMYEQLMGELAAARSYICQQDARMQDLVVRIRRLQRRVVSTLEAETNVVLNPGAAPPPRTYRLVSVPSTLSVA